MPFRRANELGFILLVLFLFLVLDLVLVLEDEKFIVKLVDSVTPPAQTVGTNLTTEATSEHLAARTS